jgi:hypothetical protein
MDINMSEFQLKCAVAKGNIVFCAYKEKENCTDFDKAMGQDKILDKITPSMREAFEWAQDKNLEVREERYEGRCNNGEGAWLHKSTIKYEGEAEFMEFDQFLEMVGDYNHQAELEEHHG